jgi:hypothetical protein
MVSVLARVPGLSYSFDPLIAEAKRRARRRRWLSLLAVVVVAAAAAATLELRSASGFGVPAADSRPVTHIVIKDFPSTVYVNLKTGRKTVKTYGGEMWFEQGRHGWHHSVSTEGGRPTGDQVWQAQYTRPNTQAAAVDRFYAMLATNFRAALRSGRFQLVGRGTFAGRHVDWINVLPRQDQHWYGLRRLEAGIDARTYRPILLRNQAGKRLDYERILLAKAIAYDAADFEAHGPKGPTAVPRQLPTGFAFGSPDSSGSQGNVVREPWLTAGTTLGRLKLRAVRPFTIRRSKHHFSYGAHNPRPIRGLALVYAPSRTTAASSPTRINVYGPQWQPATTTRVTTVYEVPRLPRVPPWGLVPAGSIELQRGLTTLGNRVVHTLSIGYLRERGLFITIRTPEGQHAALQIARALRGAPK